MSYYVTFDQDDLQIILDLVKNILVEKVKVLSFY